MSTIDQAASSITLEKMLKHAKRQLQIQQSAAANSHQTKARRDLAEIKAKEWQHRIDAILTEQQRRAEAEALALARRPYETPAPHDSGHAAFNELMMLEDNLTRAELAAQKFTQLAQKANSDKEKDEQTMRAKYWTMRATNAESRIEEFLMMHKDDAFKPWLEDIEVDSGQLH